MEIDYNNLIDLAGADGHNCYCLYFGKIARA